MVNNSTIFQIIIQYTNLFNASILNYFMDYKEETRKVYDAFPGYFDEKFEGYKNQVINDELDEATRHFPINARILDLGSGTGNHASFFQQRGYRVLCLDNSKAMLKKCREKGLACVLMDFESLGFQENSFDVIWAYTSLLHVPKANVARVIQSIKSAIKPEGFFGVSFKEGDGEGFVDFAQGGKRWFSHYKDTEVRGLLKDFQIVRHWRSCIGDKVFLDYLCRRA